MVICLERDADLHMAQLMPLQLTVSCFSKIQIGLTFLVLAHPGSPGKRAVKRVCVGVCVSISVTDVFSDYSWVFVDRKQSERVVPAAAAADSITDISLKQSFQQRTHLARQRLRQINFLHNDKRTRKSTQCSQNSRPCFTGLLR